MIFLGGGFSLWEMIFIRRTECTQIRPKSPGRRVRGPLLPSRHLEVDPPGGELGQPGPAGLAVLPVLALPRRQQQVVVVTVGVLGAMSVDGEIVLSRNMASSLYN